MLTISFDIYEIIIDDDESYRIGSVDNNYNYDFCYNDQDALTFSPRKHSIKIYKDNKIYKSAIVCAVPLGMKVSGTSAVIEKDDIFICCANKVFSLKLPDLTLNWITKVDEASCYGIYKADNGLFSYGEIEVARLDYNGKIVWSTGVIDILANIDSDQDCFILHDTFIELLDFNYNRYKLDFNGNFIEIIKSDIQKREDLTYPKRMKKEPWWKIWK
jgi:hypothetical protein